MHLFRREEHNIKPRSLGIVFRDLRVSGLTAASSYFPTLGSLFNPMSIIENVQSLRHPNVRDILSGFEGVMKPGEMIRKSYPYYFVFFPAKFGQVVLGNPGSGCTTFLKTITNQTKEYHSVSGEIHYDAFSPEELANHFRGDVQYSPEDDVHFPTLTVQQTINFAATARTPRDRMLTSRKSFADRITTTLATIFGLRHALKTSVGDAAIRGVSGGEKKRVSIAEGLASRATIGAWDKCVTYFVVFSHQH
jgi:ATP-binding cassette subfamily G (WHITE) protein 2 (SNQ2)